MSSTTPIEQRFPGRATRLKLRDRTLKFGPRPMFMGIVNVTPDSFSDGGRFYSKQASVEHGLRLHAEGAEILDIGGESTRPYSQPVAVAEELGRVIPVIESLARQASAVISIDTSKAEVARAAVAAGAEIINDITGLAGDPEMIDVAVQSGAAVCAMHMQGTPQTMQDNPKYANVVRDIHQWLMDRRDTLEARGIPRERILLDPGIGFGKTHQHNLDLIAGYSEFHDLGCPLLGGYSRKGFIAKVLGDKEADRSIAGVGVAIHLALQGVQVLRVHDVAAVRQALLLFEATGGLTGCAWRLDS